MPRKKIEVPPEVLKDVSLQVKAALANINAMSFNMVRCLPENIQSSIELAGRQLTYAHVQLEKLSTPSATPKRMTIKKTKDTLKKLSDVELQPEDHE